MTRDSVPALIDLDTDKRELLDRLRTFVNETLIPLEPAFLAGRRDAVESGLDSARQQAREAGFWLPQIPTEHGGLGLNLLEHGLFSIELGRSLLGHVACNCQAPDAGNMEILIEHGTAGQHERFLKPLLAGEIHSCFGMTEPEHAGSNPAVLSTRAERDGDEWVINGHKWYTTAADGAAFCIVMAVTDPNTKPHDGASMIIVPTDTPGYEFVRNIPVMGETGSGFFSHAEIRFNSARVPLDNTLGKPGTGFAIAQERLGPGRIHHCMRWLGICERAFEMMCTYAASRELSPGKPLASRQAVQHWIAESRAEIDAARLLVADTAKIMDRDGQYAARTRVSLIKFHTAGVLQRVVDRALQVHGALGMCDDTPLAWWYRHERAARIYDGPDEVHKTTAARHLLKPFFKSGSV